MRPHLFKTLATAAVAMGAQPAGATLNLIVSGGVLQGATGVPVGAQTLNVNFVPGRCDFIFVECGAGGGATMLFNHDPAGAQQAAIALFSPVGIGSFQSPDSNSSSFHINIAGCATTLFPENSTCIVRTPYNVSGLAVDFEGAAVVAGDPSFQTPKPGHFPATTPANVTSTWAVWTVATDVPEPATAAVLLAAAGGLAGARAGRKSRRRQRKQQ
ncbi:MAG: PEP-CTERM sorting domain-containing protein [Acetobacteraceae bacterium]